MEASDFDPRPVDQPCTPNPRRNLRPISTDPRLDACNEQGYEHERFFPDSHYFAARIPQLYSGMVATNETSEGDSARMKCCCGRADCAYLEHNHAALGGLEKDLETAARLGQALLSRHESYINESQAERARLSTTISELQTERTSLQTANEKIVAENRDLLQRLEHLNGSLADSDRDVKRLETLLLECELEVKRLNGLVRRTDELDGRVQEMERERHSLNKQLEEGRDEVRSTLTRWRESERKVRELEEEVRRIEWEAQLDREKHEQIVARLEKERALERELGGAEGRLKAAAAVQSIDKNGTGSKAVVGHFVRDILQDNANLQAGIAELRQLLQSSNEEVQNLREQIMLHQPVAEDDTGHEPYRSVSLDRELQPDMEASKQVQQEVHVHHHYHAKLAKTRNMTRRPSKRRAVMPGQNIHSDSSTPSTPISKPQRYHSSPIIPMNLHQSQQQSNRWSIQSSATMSSVLSSIPSSPRSYFDRGGSIFDRLEQGEDSSRPTSPESMAEFGLFGPSQRRYRKDQIGLDACEEEDVEKPTFDMSPMAESKPCFDANDLPTPLDTPFETPPDLEEPELEEEMTPKPNTVARPLITVTEMSIPPEPEHRPPDNEHAGMDNSLTTRETNEETANCSPSPKLIAQPSKIIFNTLPEIRPSLNRKGSHETLVSISGMDIHIAQRVSATSTLELLHSHFAHAPTQARKVSAAQPLASVTEYTAISTPSHLDRQESRQTLRNTPSSMDVLSGIAIPKTRALREASQTGAIGRLGGWVRGKWGIAPMKSVGNLRSVSSGHDAGSKRLDTSLYTERDIPRTDSEISSQKSDVGPACPKVFALPTKDIPNPFHARIDPAILFAGRPPGINQPGFIPGFRAAVMNKPTPSQVMASVIDEESLKESLGNEL